MPTPLRKRKEAAWDLLQGGLFGSLYGADIDIPTQYLLLDTFSDDRTAGSINGTTCDTGQIRTVTDDNLKLSLANGKANGATGGVGVGNPGLWYPSQTRVNGLLLLGTFTMTAATMDIGWDANAAGAISWSIRPVVSSNLTVRDNGSAIAVGVAIIAGTAYQVALALRSNGGVFYLIKGGIYTTWTLFWSSALGTGNLFPGFITGGTTDVWTTDDVRIPVDLFIPAPLAYDTFTRADGALGSTETTGPDTQVISALAWQFTTGIWTITTNKAVGTPVPGADVIVNGGFATDSDWTKGAGWAIASGTANATTATSDLTQTVAPLTVGRWYKVVYTVSGFAAGTVKVVYSPADVARAADGTFTEIARATTTAFLLRGAGFTGSIDNVSANLLATAELFSSVTVSTADVIADVGVTLSAATNGRPAGLVLNLDSISNPQNFILAYLDGKGLCVLDQCVAGVYTNKFLTAITYSAGAVLRVVRDGTSCRVFYNGAAVSTVQTMTVNTNKLHGLFSTDAANSLDNFTVWARGTSGEYGVLDNY